MDSNSNSIKTVLVTGSNKGIGLGIVKGLLEKEALYKVILTSRNEDLGNDSINQLKNINEIKTKAENNLFYHQLDITNNESVTNCFEWIKNKFGQVDIWVNNAAVATKGPKFDIDVFNFTFPINVFATISVSERLINENIIKKNGKIINIGSSAGNLSKLKNEELKNKFRNNNDSVERLLELAEEFKQSILNNTVVQDGWPEAAYAVSKIFINIYGRILANNKRVLENNIGVYTLCPGWVRTDLAGQNAHKSIEEGILTPIYLIELPEGILPEYQGKYFYEQKIASFDS